MLNRLHIQRKIEIEPDRAAMMLEMLHQEQFTSEQAAHADLWLSYGNWMFKGTNPTLEYADFFPDADQTDKAKKRKQDAGFVVMKAVDYRKAMQNAYKAGEMQGERKAWHEQNKCTTSDSRG